MPIAVTPVLAWRIWADAAEPGVASAAPAVPKTPAAIRRVARNPVTLVIFLSFLPAPRSAVLL
jgi:hypothetical protein